MKELASTELKKWSCLVTQSHSYRPGTPVFVCRPQQAEHYESLRLSEAAGSGASG